MSKKLYVLGLKIPYSIYFFLFQMYIIYKKGTAFSAKLLITSSKQ
jgi:hypothetical protein